MKYSLFLISILLVFSATSCKKLKGCKDIEAANFSEKAKIDDGSCTYEGELSFWFNESKSMNLVSLGITSLTVYFNDVSQGTIDPEVWSIGPECNGENTHTFKVDLGQNHSENISYVLRDQTGTTRFSNNTIVSKNECKSRQL